MLFKGKRIKGFWPFSKPVINHPLLIIIIVTLTSQCLLPGPNTDEKQKEPELQYKVGGQELPNSVFNICSSHGQQYDGIQYM
jgi:hypothetical protein